jgi:hypothetical protein
VNPAFHSRYTYRFTMQETVMRRDPDQGDLFSANPSQQSQPGPSGRARGSGVGQPIQKTMPRCDRPMSKSQLAYQDTAARRWQKRQRREQDKREGISPAQRNIADALENGRQPPRWAIEKRRKELCKGLEFLDTMGKVFNLEDFRLRRSISHELQAAREARFRALSGGIGTPRKDKA